MTSFISDQDFTTPAHIRTAPPDDERAPGAPKNPSRPLLSIIFLAAVWLVVSAVPFGYIGAGRYDVFWSDAVTGVTIAIVTTLRLLHPRLISFGWVTGGLAGWLLVAPLVLQYGWSTSTVNDVIVGILVLTCAALANGDDRDG
ncbi:SPW repeat domain-containing protein [Dactylosporangium sp. CA-092794]|uniref:SPW repeat domain-containing protein n=1 Tax=Dactylosporangium sp. CA-092794 TaxID=3239929 RepID=UPI003D8D5CDB